MLPSPLRLVTVEYTPYAEQGRILPLLATHGVTPCVAVRSGTSGSSLATLLRDARDQGVAMVLWPLLGPESGLYLNKGSADAWLRNLRDLAVWLRVEGLAVAGILVDVEPSRPTLAELAAPASFLWRLIKSRDRIAFDASTGSFQDVRDLIRDMGAEALAVLFPPVVDDALAGRHGWEDLFGGPVACVDWDRYYVMAYPSWFVQTGRSIGVTWNVAHHLAAAYAQDARRLWGDKVILALGVTNPGEGHESLIYGDPALLRHAVAAVRHAGVRDLALYDLQGVLASADPAAWFQALACPDEGLPPDGRWMAASLRRAVGLLGPPMELWR